MTDAEEKKELEKGIEQFRKDNELLFRRIDELNSKCELLDFENKILKNRCRKINANTIINFASYILYYSMNPDSKMDIPSCVYEEVEIKFAKWIRMEYPEDEKTCNNCLHMWERLKADVKGKLSGVSCCFCNPDKYEKKKKKSIVKKCINGDGKGNCIAKEEAPFDSFICENGEMFEPYEEE